jgi:hypothetical protein
LAGQTEARAVSAVTDGNGIARVRYWAPFRTDQENDTVVTITSRPAGDDFRAAIFRQVDIFLRAANRPSFPGVNACGFMIEPLKPAYDKNELIFFTATQLVGDGSTCGSNEIARYEWDLGDGSGRREGRNIEHRYENAASYTVTLFTTERGSGCQVFCQGTITVR